MEILLNLSTRAKLLSCVGMMVAIMAVISAVGYRNADRLKESQESLFTDDLSVAFDMMSLRNVINRERVLLLSLTLADPAEHKQMFHELVQETKETTSILDRLNLQKESDAEFSRRLDKLNEAHRNFYAIRDGDVIPALKAGKRHEASAIILGPLQDRFLTLRAIADESGQHQFEQAQERMRESEALVDSAYSMLIGANVAALIAGLLLVLWLDRVIAAPLKQATGVAQRIAAGDLTVNVPTSTSNDEVGQLLRALDAMVQAWKLQVKETNTGIVTLSAAASEILAGTMQVAAGTTETAAAVSETTATVEEVKQTALLASQKARRVSDAAQKASQAAADGRRAVEGGMEGMESIQEHMESIADTIVRLSERSQAIAEIIATVGGLAEQSNLLAVNAAIEAAKAGEQGKGFAVVAQEVKDLADQSRQATRQVRQILSEIQKAISTAVMSTEQGSRTVASGVEQTNEAGKAIRILAGSIEDAAQVAAQIAATSQQQLAGMDQIAMAMENIKQVSAENAAGSRQSEASAQNLHELGQKLKQMSERFKL
jgi:methyl-accepting chemotaxis protein